MAIGKGLKFIRVRGRIVPIKAGSSKTPRKIAGKALGVASTVSLVAGVGGSFNKEGSKKRKKKQNFSKDVATGIGAFAGIGLGRGGIQKVAGALVGAGAGRLFRSLSLGITNTITDNTIHRKKSRK